MEAPIKFSSVIQDVDYLDSLKPQNVLVINFSPIRRENCTDLSTFISKYEARQYGIIRRLTDLTGYIKERQILSPLDIDKKSVEFFKVFLDDMDIFLANSYDLSLKAKTKQEEIYRRLLVKYPQIADLLLIPSSGDIYTYRLLKQQEFLEGENEDYVYCFCGGNIKLAKRTAKGLEKKEIEKIKERTRFLAHEKFYAMLERDDVKELDRLLVIDHFVESWIWKASWFTAPMWHMYNIIQELLSPTGRIQKDSYKFDIKFMRDNL